jgi:hypothetical protein
MPCDQNSNRNSPSEWSKVNNDFFLKEPPTNVESISKDNLLDKIELKKLKEYNEYLEACLGSILTELEKREIAEEIIDNATENGQVSIFSFWENHKQKDIARLQKELDKFSEHEKQIIKELLQNKL